MMPREREREKERNVDIAGNGYDVCFLSIESEPNLENDLFTHSHLLALRKISQQQSNASPVLKKQQSTDRHLLDENNPSSSISRKKPHWNRSASKDG